MTLCIIKHQWCLWLSGLAGLIAYNWSQPAMKSSVKIIHASFFLTNLKALQSLVLKGVHVSRDFPL
ncbi:Hypoxia-responsive family protein [Fagus crenata]